MCDPFKFTIRVIASGLDFLTRPHDILAAGDVRRAAEHAAADVFAEKEAETEVGEPLIGRCDRCDKWTMSETLRRTSGLCTDCNHDSLTPQSQPRLQGCNRCDGPLLPADQLPGGLCPSCVEYYDERIAPGSPAEDCPDTSSAGGSVTPRPWASMDELDVRRWMREDAQLDRLRDALSVGGLPAWEAELLAKASSTVGKTTSDRCANPLCDHTRYVHIPSGGCDVDAHYKVPPCACAGFTDPPSPSSTILPVVGVPSRKTDAAARDVEAGEVDATPIESTSPRPTIDIIRDVLGQHHPWEGAGGIDCSPSNATWEYPYSVEHLRHFDTREQWREHVAPLIAAALNPTTNHAADTFPQYRGK